jgi:hypothetical protein
MQASAVLQSTHACASSTRLQNKLYCTKHATTHATRQLGAHAHARAHACKHPRSYKAHTHAPTTRASNTKPYCTKHALEHAIGHLGAHAHAGAHPCKHPRSFKAHAHALALPAFKTSCTVPGKQLRMQLGTWGHTRMRGHTHASIRALTKYTRMRQQHTQATYSRTAPSMLQGDQ